MAGMDAPVTSGSAPRLAVVIASANRPDVLHDGVASVLKQSTLPAQIIVTLPGDDHILDETRRLPRVQVVVGERGLTRQRNRAIDALLPEVEIVTFIDDDSELRDDYLAWTVRAFEAHPDVVLATGREVADGVREGGIARSRAKTAIAADTAYRLAESALHVEAADPTVVYGCNMSVRRIAFDKVRFDERLPLYGWAEDFDFALSCAPLGRIVRIENCRMVHLGVSAGRLSGRRYGYSQVMNVVYIWRKRTGASSRVMLKRILRPLVANTIYLFVPGQKVDRWGRLRGNLIALARALSGRIDPEYILRM